MRLIRRVERLEAAAAARVEAGPVGLCWTCDEVLVDRGALEPGQHVAVDLELGEESGAVLEVRIRERVAWMEGDLGDVVRSGRRVGRVVSADGGLLTYALGEDSAAAESGGR